MFEFAKMTAKCCESEKMAENDQIERRWWKRAEEGLRCELKRGR
jgi:hypothetical protein